MMKIIVSYSIAFVFFFKQTNVKLINQKNKCDAF